MNKRYIFTFPPDIVNRPIVSEIAKHYDVMVNILNADVTSGREGKLVVELEGERENITRSLEYAQECGVICIPILRQLQFDQDSCVACGVCTSVCFSGALTLDEVNWELQFDPEKCVVCGRCVKACPLRLFAIAMET